MLQINQKKYEDIYNVVFDNKLNETFYNSYAISNCQEFLYFLHEEVAEKYIMLDQDRNANQAFKIGLPNKDGWAAYANNGHLFVKRFQHVDGVEYPDFGYSSFETYTCDYMTEIESLSPLFELESDCSIEHKEIWNLYDNVKTPENETDIDDIILPYVQTLENINYTVLH